MRRNMRVREMLALCAVLSVFVGPMESIVLSDAHVGQHQPASVRDDVSSGNPPNILFILVDDMGYGDLGCYGNELIDTPNIDRLSTQGMRFSDAYSMPVCTPTRVSIASGKNPATLHIQHPNPHNRPWGKLLIPRMYWRLPLEQTTIAEALAERGYVSAHLGKWGCGYSPVQQGYTEAPDDDVAGRYAEAVNRFVDANPYEQIGDHLNQAVRFIESRRAEPFFCTFATTMPHAPPQARPQLIEKYQRRFAEKRSAMHPAYAAMCETIDEATGILLDVLVALELADSTLVILYSDNGGVISERGYVPAGFDEPITSNWPLRGEKGSLYEGGVRVPLIVRWPGRVAPGDETDAVVTCEDFFPTLCEIAGVQPPADLDGRSFLSVLTGDDTPDRGPVFWHYPRYHHSTPSSAIRKGRYKLIEFYEDNHVELYDLETDIAERFNLAEGRPELADELRDELHDWLESRDARLPARNPDYDPARELIWGPRDSKNWPKQFGIRE